MTAPIVPSDGLPWLGPVPLPDCRTCLSWVQIAPGMHLCQAQEAGVQCFRGARYRPAQPIQLWDRT